MPSPLIANLVAMVRLWPPSPGRSNSRKTAPGLLGLLGWTLTGWVVLAPVHGAEPAPSIPRVTPQAPCAEAFRSIPLSLGRLFLPAGYRPHDDRVDVLIHFHGHPPLVCSNLLASGRSAVIITVNVNGLSAAYAKPFHDPSVFPGLLDEAKRTLTPELPGSWSFGAIVVSSFSAGYGAVRELLRQPASQARITDLVLADSLYAGYVEQDGRRVPDPSQIEPFAKFARRAVDGHVGFLLTHTQLIPEGYASTRETADALLQACGLQRQPASGRDATGLELESTAAQGRFAVRSYQGSSGQDHLDHLRRLAAALQFTSLPPKASQIPHPAHAPE